MNAALSQADERKARKRARDLAGGDRVSFESKIMLMVLSAGLPGSALALYMLWQAAHSTRVQWTFTILVLAFWLGFSLAVRQRVIRPLQTLSNLLAALHEEDYSIRARGARRDDALGEVLLEVNALGEIMREQRLDSLEATALLRTVMSEVDVAVFTFDGHGQLRLVNRAGESLLGQTAERALGLSAEELGVSDWLQGDSVRTIQLGPSDRRWGLRRSHFRKGGLPHNVIVLSDLSQELREEEREAWKRLVRVIGHELNNSLAPIKSIAGSLEALIEREPLPDDWREDTRRGLTVIAGRTESLNRFMTAYARLARLPKPSLQSIRISDLISRVSGLERRLPVSVKTGPDVTVRADPDQLEQLLINVVGNAVDAALETGGGVEMGWETSARFLEVWIDDDGPGLPNTSNLFVPFFTTKLGGSGIGLVLSRQIAEGHGGTLTLENRNGARGCQARLRLPR